MEIMLNNIKLIDIEKIKERIKWIELDFNSFSSLKGNKDLLEMSFQDTKKELI